MNEVKLPPGMKPSEEVALEAHCDARRSTEEAICDTLDVRDREWRKELDAKDAEAAPPRQAG
jgi:hypothetical protein